MSYDDRKVVPFTYIDQTISTAAELAEITLPDGYQGIPVDVAFTTNATATTTSACTINIGNNTTATLYGQASIAVTAANTAAVVTYTATAGSLDNDTVSPAVIPAGGTFMVDTGGEPGAGAGDLTVYVEIWK